MRIGQTTKYAMIAMIAGTAGFIMGGGSVPALLDLASQEISKTFEAAETSGGQESTMTEALNYLRDQVAESARRVATLFD
ncbi:MAG: hypothetical protein VYE68_04665 [Acidobacteriota bacterium]|nr:hypothetical protein [Acidobacteriota bacterium]